MKLMYDLTKTSYHSIHFKPNKYRKFKAIKIYVCHYTHLSPANCILDVILHVSKFFVEKCPYHQASYCFLYFWLLQNKTEIYEVCHYECLIVLGELNS